MLCWVPFVWALFATIERHKALILTILIGYLFLPQAQFKIVEGVPLITKLTLIGFSVALIAPWKFYEKIANFTFKQADIPMLIWCLVPIATSISNGLGVPDGLSTSFSRIMDWGVPYFSGRIAFTSAKEMSLLDKYLFIGGLIYVPLCLFEIKMSPQLHNMLYGYHQHSFAQTIRMGGFRPTVFLYHGLALALWMMAASVCAFFHLALSKEKLPLSFKLWAVVLIGTFILCKSAGSWVLFSICGIGILLGVRFNSKLILQLMLLIPLLYISTRSSGLWSGENMVQLNAKLFGEERAESLGFRIMNENLVIQHALKQPILGWGGWGRSLVLIPGTDNTCIVDGLWAAALGVNGFIGLISILLATLLPVYLALLRFPPKTWSYSENSAIVPFMFIGAAYTIDNLLNNMPTPYFLLGLGALVSQVYKPITAYEINDIKQDYRHSQLAQDNI